MELDYRGIIEAMPVGYAHHKIILDELAKPVDYRYIEVNKSFEIQTGLKRDDILGKRVTEIIPTIRESDFDWIDFYGRVAIYGESRDIEQYSEPLGKWYRVSARPFGKGEFITYVTDITEEKRELEEKMAILMVSNDIVFELDEDYRYIDLIVQDEETLFASKEIFLEKRVDEVLDRELGERVLKALDIVKESHKKETLVYKSTEEDGRWFYAEVK